jgi:hypothetical protein
MLALSLSRVAPVRAETTVSFPATASATICEGTCTSKEGLLVLYDLDGAEHRGLVDFSGVIGGNGGVPDGANIRSAAVEFQVSQGDASDVRAACLAESWDATWATWWRREKDVYWSEGGAEGASRVGDEEDLTVAGSTARFDATGCVRRWMNGGVQAGFVLDLDSNESKEDWVYLWSHTAEDGLVPVLTVTYDASGTDTGSIDTGADSGPADSADDSGALPPEETDADGDRFSLGDGDCDDNNPDVYPGRDERCNGIDDDCDGEIDEACVGGPAPGTGCSCGEGKGAALVGFVALAAGLRRRTTPSASPATRPTGTSPS